MGESSVSKYERLESRLLILNLGSKDKFWNVITVVFLTQDSLRMKRS